MTIREVNLIIEKIPYIMDAIEGACMFAHERAITSEDEEMAEKIEEHLYDLLGRVCLEMEVSQRKYIQELKN